MAADYVNLLSLNKASLVERTRENSLGTKTLVLDYNLQTGGAKEDAAEWLNTNRDTLTDPSFEHKTYTGTWKCVSIEYDSATKKIRQTFKIDASLEDDVAQRSAGGDTLRSYYWRIVNPDDYNIPYYKTTDGSATAFADLYWIDTGTTENSVAVYYDSTDTYAQWFNGSSFIISAIADVGGSPTNYFTSAADVGTYSGVGSYIATTVVIATVTSEGEAWTKSCVDNGDGTYDVTITRVDSSEFDGYGAAQNKFYSEETTTTINSGEVKFVSDGGSEPDAIRNATTHVYEVKRISNTPMENGLFRTVVMTRTATVNISFAEDFPSDFAPAGQNPKFTVYRNYEEANLRSLLNGLSATLVNSPSVSINEFGLYDGMVMQR